MINEAHVIDPVAALLACRQERDELAAGLESISYLIEPHFKGAAGRSMNAAEIMQFIVECGKSIDGEIDRADALAGQLAAALKTINEVADYLLDNPATSAEVHAGNTLRAALAAPSLADGGAGIDE
jgi:hypothetical protein